MTLTHIPHVQRTYIKGRNGTKNIEALADDLECLQISQLTLSMHYKETNKKKTLYFICTKLIANFYEHGAKCDKWKCKLQHTKNSKITWKSCTDPHGMY